MWVETRGQGHESLADHRVKEAKADIRCGVRKGPAVAVETADARAIHDAASCDEELVHASFTL